MSRKYLAVNVILLVLLVSFTGVMLYSQWPFLHGSRSEPPKVDPVALSAITRGIQIGNAPATAVCPAGYSCSVDSKGNTIVWSDRPSASASTSDCTGSSRTDGALCIAGEWWVPERRVKAVSHGHQSPAVTGDGNVISYGDKK